jgi:hypothetical protein
MDGGDLSVFTAKVTCERDWDVNVSSIFHVVQLSFQSAWRSFQSFWSRVHRQNIRHNSRREVGVGGRHIVQALVVTLVIGNC